MRTTALLDIGIKIVLKFEMPRKKLLHTHLFPYHIVARSNNKDQFCLPISEVWKIFNHLLLQTTVKFHFQIHAFILMNNHYHLIGSTSKSTPLPKVMEWLQRSANRTIHRKANRINHLFGGPYNGSLITNEIYYYHALRYLYQNPVKAKITNKVQNYKFSTINKSTIPLVSPITGIESLIPKNFTDFISYLNFQYSNEENNILKKSLTKSQMKFPSRLNAKDKKTLIYCK